MNPAAPPTMVLKFSITLPSSVTCRGSQRSGLAFPQAPSHGPRRAFSHSGHLPLLGGVVSMRISWWTKFGVTAMIAVLLWGASGFAQSGSTDEAKRKIKSKTTPVYPELARRMNVTGKVKIEVVISPDGRVKSTRVVGGHPLLVQTCQDAVKEWKFLSAAEETTPIVEFEFHGN